MRRHVVVSAILLAAVAALSRTAASVWHARRTVELRVASRSTRAERVRGVIVSDDGIGVRTIDAFTPFTRRLAARSVNATFHAVDGAPITGEMVIRRFGLSGGGVTRGWSQGGFVLYTDGDRTGFRGVLAQ